MAQVYTVLCTDEKVFMMGHKFIRGYFFAGGASGRIVVHGELLNAGGLPALPGGKQEGANVVPAALKEFREETGYELREQDAHIGILRKAGYAAIYAFVTIPLFQEIVNQTARNLAVGVQAQDAVIQGQYGAHEYARLMQDFPHVPADNELDAVRLMDVEDQQDWDEITTWKDDDDIGWYYVILKELRDLPPAKIQGPAHT